MNIKISEKNNNYWDLKAVFNDSSEYKNILKEHLHFTEFANEKVVIVYIDKTQYNEKCFIELAKKIALNNKRSLNIYFESFNDFNIQINKALHNFVFQYEYDMHKLWNKKNKTIADDKKYELILIDAQKYLNEFKSTMNTIESVNFARDLQIMAPNYLNPKTYVDLIIDKFKHNKDIKIKVLSKNEIENEQMGLLLGVSAGSKYDPSVVVLEYIGNNKSNEKNAIIGKGITFDAGGYNIKIQKNMEEMKFDMSGSAIAASIMLLTSVEKIKTNLVCLLMITDNMISSNAITADCVLTASNGKTVEINNTDAEGRLAMADGLVYAQKKLGATTLIDIATLTGAVISALGSTYTGVWTTNDNDWKKMQNASKNANELIWKMPFHDDYFKYMSKSKVADFKNTDLSGKAGSSSAAMFLKQFVDKKNYIHLDIAGTANVDGDPKGIMVKTIFEYLKQS